MGIVRSIQKGEAPAGKFSKAAQKAAKSMKKSSVRKYAKTKHDDLPKKVKEERDYKDEYKKFQSSKKAKKYRAELNKYNRQKGTYGNGDGKDASHKGGKIVGFESQSKNRGRAEKSRLKKESMNEREMSIKDAFKDLVKDHGSKKALDILTSVLTGGIGFEDPKKKKKFQQKLLKKMTTEAKYKGYDYKRQKRKDGLPLIVPALRKTFSDMKDLKKYIDKHGTMESVDEAVYKLKRGSTNKDLDELDALMARAGFKGKPDFNKMTWSIKNKNPKIAKIIKSKGGKKIREGTCGYGIDGKIGEEPAGPNLMKKIKAISKDKEKKKLLKSKKVNERLNQSQAKTLLRQLGGNKFIMMTGAKQMSIGKNGLTMKIGRNSKSITHVAIDLDRGKDLYIMKFIRVRKGIPKVVKQYDSVYADNLNNIFEKETGLYTRL